MTSAVNWRQLLAGSAAPPPGRPLSPAEFGPSTPQLLAAMNALRETRWYESVGTAIGPDDRAIPVESWQDALLIQSDSDRYVRGGTLTGPWMEMHRCDDAHPQRHGWWVSARQLITDSVEVITPSVQGLDIERTLQLTDYVYDFLNLLMMEIVFADVSRCEYFREQLSWFHAGHFPCGWDGDWPVGRMRVY